MKRPKKLSASFVKTVNRPGRYGDGRGGFGLSLLVKPTTTGRLSKTWSQRLRIHGRSVNIGLGAYPVVTLAEAREVALANRRTVARGRDPRSGGVPTFAEAVETVIAIHSLEQQARDGAAGAPADRSRDEMGCRTEGYREDNPAGDAISAALPRNSTRVRHQRALPHRRVGAALDRIRSSGANTTTKLALEMLVLTACRSGEVRRARWPEFDLKSKIWTVPAERTKSGREHRVPLSSGALKVLEQAKALGAGTDLVFPGLRGRRLGDATLSLLLRRLEMPCVPHGMRSSFRDWCSETGVAREVAEASLAHVVKNKVEAAYARSDLLEQRREVMEEWSDYLLR